MSGKNLVAFMDGTWNNSKSRTNVRRLYDLANVDDKSQQLCDYIDGVGGGEYSTIVIGWLKRVRAAMTGRGMAPRLRATYSFLAENYEPGDRIYLFGFSRGAYSARSLCHLLDSVGLAPKAYRDAHRDYAKQVFWKYRLATYGDGNDRSFASDWVKPPVEFLGIWDTVGAVRNPWAGQHWYHQVHKCPSTRKVAHAVSLDERRKLYNIHSMHTQGNGTIDDPTINEVWFPGDHADVGGGHKDDATMARVSLTWMLTQLPDGLLLNDTSEFLEWRPHHLAKRHEMKKGVFRGFRKGPRCLHPRATLHESVFALHEENGYLPVPMNAETLQAKMTKHQF